MHLYALADARMERPGVIGSPLCILVLSPFPENTRAGDTQCNAINQSINQSTQKSARRVLRLFLTALINWVTKVEVPGCREIERLGQAHNYFSSSPDRVAATVWSNLPQPGPKLLFQELLAY